jgi:hypothetical protein
MQDGEVMGMGMRMGRGWDEDALLCKQLCMYYR